VEILTVDGSGGLGGHDARGETHPSTGPKSQKMSLADGATLVVPKASIVTLRY
jgi:hypothetical protein